MDKHAVTPGAVIPAREMLAEVLYLVNHPQHALAECQAVLEVVRNRFNALFGRATAAEAVGNTEAANGKLTQISVGRERPELVTARKKITAAAHEVLLQPFDPQQPSYA